VNEVMKKMKASAKGTRNCRNGSTSLGSSNWTGGGLVSASTTSEGASSSATTRGPASTAASTSPSRTSCSASASEATGRTSRPAASRGCADDEAAVTATLVGPPSSRAGTTALAIATTRKNTVLNRNVLSRSLTLISRAATRRAAASVVTGTPPGRFR
jgi:hypothetical protein